MIAHDFGFDPNVDGTLTSNLHAIAIQLSFIGEISGLALTAERIAANPPIITTYNAAIDDAADDKFSENFFVGNPDRCQNRAQITYERNSQQQQLFRESMRTWESYNGLSAALEFGADAPRYRRGENQPEGAVAPEWARDWNGAEMPWSRQYYLDASRLLVQQQLPRPRGDLVNMSEQAMGVVCGVLNVPRGMLASDSTVRAGVEAVSEAMHRTVNRWADTLGNLMTATYNHTFGIQDLRDELRIRLETKRTSPFDMAERLLTEEDLFEAEAKTRVRLAFDLPPSTTPEQLDAMYDRGILSWQTYGKAKLRLNNFSGDQLASDTDPLTKEEQRQLLLGPPKPTDQPQKKKKKTKSSAK